jgi:hypothetical protein
MENASKTLMEEKEAAVRRPAAPPAPQGKQEVLVGPPFCPQRFLPSRRPLEAHWHRYLQISIALSTLLDSVILFG